ESTAYDPAMRLRPVRHVIDAAAPPGAVVFDAAAGTVTNAGDRPVTVRSVATVHAIDDVDGPLRMFRHGYQSRSPTGGAWFGVDRDPSSAAGSVELLRAAHHADQRVVQQADELRSEWVTVLGDDASAVALGFAGGDRHDGTFRLRRDD